MSPEDLKFRSQVLVKMLGGVKAAAAVEGCRMQHSQIARCISDQHMDTSLPIDVVLALETAAGWPVVTLPMSEVSMSVEPHGVVAEPGELVRPMIRECSEMHDAMLGNCASVAMKEIRDVVVLGFRAWKDWRHWNLQRAPVALPSRRAAE